MDRLRLFLLSFFLLALTTPHFLAQAMPAAQIEVAKISDALRSRNFTLALTLSQSASEKYPADYRLWTLRGMATAGTGNLPQALSAYQHALKLAPDYLPALEGAAQSEFQMGQQGAKPLLLKVLAQHPQDPTSHAMLGVLEYKEKNCSDAVTHFEKAGAVIRSQPEALAEYGICLATLKRDEDAVTVFSDALALDPAQIEARYNLALAQWNLHRADDALATIAPLIKAKPIDADALSLATEILESKGQTNDAIELLRTAILDNPKDVDAYLQFATVSFDHASPQVGIDIVNIGLTQLPNEPRLYLVRGILLTQFGEFARAADDFEMANRLDPDLQFLGVAEGLVKSQQHQSIQALAEFRAAVKAHPNEAYAQYLLAEALQDEGIPEGSAEYIEEVAAAQRAVKLDPNLVAARDLLGAVYLENGQTDKAIQQSRASLALDPNDQQAVYHLILAMRKTNQKDQVPALLKRMIELRSNVENEQKARKGYRLNEIPSSTNQATPSAP